MTGKILVAGIGNIFLGDDGFGVEVVQRLAQVTLPENVEVADFGIRSYSLAYALMEEWELVILVDAMARGEAPGTVYTFEPELPAAGETPVTLDAHSMNPFAVLQLVSALGGKASRMLVVGCEPEIVDFEGGAMGLSPPVQEAVAVAVGVIEELAGKSRASAAWRTYSTER